MTQKDETEPDSPREPEALAEALLAFQADPPQVVKDAEADVKNRDGKKLYAYKYMSLQALLEALRPKLTELGLLWKTMPGVDEAGKPVIKYRISHVPSREYEDGVMPLVAGNSMQDLGGAFSYARRYALITVLNLAPDVDEGGAVAPPVAEKRITKGVAAQLVEEAVKQGLLPRLQLAASHVHGSDVGDCSTKAKAVAAVSKLSEGNAERLFNKIAEIGAAGQNAAEVPDV